jgi:hypothetical protein
MVTADEDKDELVFSTGTRIYANRGIVGIGPKLDVYEGYDGGISAVARHTTNFTPEEWSELADYAISQWQRLKDLYGRRG